jgi:membrane protease YdiL (CAAX protease family)
MNAIKRHPVLSYFILAFTISWAGILMAIGGLSGIPGDPAKFNSMLPMLILAMLGGPTFAGLLMTGITQGSAGLLSLLSRLIKWRVNIRWYAAALLTAPFLMTIIPFLMSLFFPEFMPRIFIADNKTSLLALGFGAGLSAGIFEELGWTGFAVPRLRERYSGFATGLIVGFLWGAWHLLVNLWSCGGAGRTFNMTLLFHSLIFSFGVLPAYRVLMVWVHDRTKSLLVVILMHACLTASNIIFVPLASGAALAVWSIVMSAALWVAAGFVALKKGTAAGSNL